MKSKLTSILLLVFAMIGNATGDQPKPNEWPFFAKLTVRVIDEAAQPIAQASVRIGFIRADTKQQIMANGETNGQGEFAAEGYSDMKIGVDARKAGYYLSGSAGTVFKDQVEGKWQPLNPTAEIIMRPIGMPVALYAKTGWIEIPAVEQPCGYDLEKGDWVAPWGKGEKSDFNFTLKRRYDNGEDFEVNVELRFSQPLDGIQVIELPAIGRNSAFKWPREAPENGYATNLATRLAHSPAVGYEKTASEEQAYFFRVRTVEQNGRITSALYGKIQGGLQLSLSDSKTSKVKLTYYLNPTSLDRNLEWDTQRNLLGGLGFMESPREP